MRSVLRVIVSVISIAFASTRATAQSPADVEFTFEETGPGEVPPGWSIPTPGFKAEVVAGEAAQGAQCATLHKSAEGASAFGNLMRTFDASAYRGRHVVLSAQVRVQSPENGDAVSSPRAQMWLRVDRPNQRMGAFDNMGDRPILPGAWSHAVIEADIDADAQQLNIGFMSLGGATVLIDQITLKSAGAARSAQESSPPKTPTAREVENLAAAARLLGYVRFFDASDQAAGVVAWDHFAVDLMEKVEDAVDARELADRLAKSFSGISPTLQVWAGTPDDAPQPPAMPDGATGVSSWRHNGAGTIAKLGQHNIYSSAIQRSPLPESAAPDAHSASFVVKSLGGGVSCRLPLKVYRDAAGTLPHGETPESWSHPAKTKLSALNRATRLAGIATAWGVFQHFYPYFDVVETDWDAALSEALIQASQDADEAAYLGTLRELVAKLHDGHGNVYNQSLAPSLRLPLALEWAGSDLVVVGKTDTVPDTVHIGDVIVSIDGRSTDDCYAEVSKSISAATDGWRRAVSPQRITSDLHTEDPAIVALRRPGGETYSVRLARSSGMPLKATSQKPANGSEVAPGVVYFDLNGAGKDALTQVMDKLNTAKGIIFDLRGYPADAAFTVIQHLIDKNVASARWNIPIVTKPDREGWQWNEAGRWNIPPAAPRWNMPVAFLTGGGAISYAESIMGIIENYKLGEIVGSTTAGTNGNVNPFILPGGYGITWTGMRVLKHDGSQHHGVGIKPTVPVEPTAQGIAAGRDEVLEKAITVVQDKIAAGR